jgi:hypothetical protein
MMEVPTMTTFIEFLKNQYVFLIAIYEVMVLGLLGKLRSLTKRGLEKRVQHLGDLEITLKDGEIGNPKILITQKLANASDIHLKVSKVEILLKANDKEIDRFYYKPPEHVLEYGEGISFSNTDPVINSLNLNWLMQCESKELRDMMPEYHGKEIMILVNGLIELSTKTTRIEKPIKGGKMIPVKSEWFKKHRTDVVMC